MSERLAHIVTLGCQMNVRDSQTLAGMLAEMGYGLTDDLERADVILYNTCSVRENPERKVYGQVAQLAELKRKRPRLVIGITGCMPQQPHEAQRMAEKLPHVDLIIGTHNIHRFPALFNQVLETGQRVVEVWHDEGEIVEGLPVRREGGLKAFVTVIYGCDYHCTFCIVPQVRGRQRSRRPEAILREVRELAESGVREVTLLGQTVDAYGKDLGDGTDLAWLLEQVSEVPGIERIRFTTSHPRDVTERLIDAMASLPKVCEHLHLPVQAGSDRILKRMGRRYTSAEYLALVDRIRERVPGVSLTTDIIVGFPGETEEDFQKTLELVERVGYDSAFTFIYSPRPNTAAPRMPDPTPMADKRERIYRLIELQNRISLERNRAMVGQEVEVLVEGESEKDPNRLSGRTRTNKMVIFPAPDPAQKAAVVGRVVKVRITHPQTWTLWGEMVPASLVAAVPA